MLLKRGCRHIHNVSLTPNGYGWLFALVVSFIFALAGLLVPNLQRQARERRFRAHNVVKFWNEFLARHQLGYFTFYLAISFTGTFDPQFDRRILAIPLALTMVFYILGVYLSTNHQDDFFTEDHKCTDNSTCHVKVRPRAVIRLLWPNALMAFVLACIAWYALRKIA